MLTFRDLARLMAPDYPFYALQAQGLDGSKRYLKSVEEMATHYLGEIRKFQPEGPYYLGGFCLGGQVAFEMAQQLHRRGQKVALLAMIDTYNFQGVPLQMTVRESLSTTREKLFFHAQNLLQLSLKEQYNYIGKKLKIASHREFERMVIRVSNLFRRGHYGAHGPDVILEHFNEEAHFAYVAEPYPDDVTIFKPRRTFTLAADPRLGWGDAVTGNLELVELPVNPGGIFMEPYVQTLAEGLKERIDEAVSKCDDARVAVSS